MESADSLVELIRERSGWLLRPRALITTIWARLFLADLFIHGIGGAKYDRISDALIRRYFHIEPPEIACVSATLYLFPQCSSQKDGTIVPQRLRDAEWNPQRHLSSLTAPEVAGLVKEKMGAVGQAEELRRAAPGDHAARHGAFVTIRELNKRMQAHLSPPLAELKEMVELGRRAQADRRIVCDREYFFALHSRENLRLLLTSLPSP